MTKFESIAVSLVDPNPEQPRLDYGDLAPLTDSIREQGVVEPIVVVAAGKRFILVAGHRRVEAAKAAGLKHIPAVVHDELDARAQIGALIAENTVRTNLTAVEEAAGIQTMLNVGWLEPGAAIGRSAEHVARAVKVAAMPEALSAKLHQATLEEAEAFAEFADDKKAVKALTAALGKGDFAWTVRNTREAKAKRDAKAAAKATLEAEGCPIVERMWDGKQKTLAALGISVEDHRACPGHAAIIGYDGSIEYVCSDAPTYKHATATSKEEAKREKERAKERAEYDKRVADWKIARDVRVEFVHKLLRAPKLTTGIVPWAFGVLYAGCGSSYQLAERFESIWGNRPGAITEKHAPAMIAALAVAGIESEMQLTYTQSVRATKAYLELLATEGYTLSPVERAYYDELVTKSAGIKASDECDQDCENCERDNCEAAS